MENTEKAPGTSTVQCGCLKPKAIFVYVLLALIAHSTLWLLVGVILSLYSARPMAGQVLPSARPYVVSPCQNIQLNWSTDGMIDLVCRW